MEREIDWKVESRKASSSSSASSQYSSSWPFVGDEKYEVFLSFHTADAFTDALYTSLDNAGVRIFRHYNDLCKGEDMGSYETTLKAIRETLKAIRDKGEEIDGSETTFKEIGGKGEKMDPETLKAIRGKGEELGPETLKVITESSIVIPILSENTVSCERCVGLLNRMLNWRPKGQMSLPIFYDIRQDDLRRMYYVFSEKHLVYDEPSFQRRWNNALGTLAQSHGLELKEDAAGDQGKLIEMIVRRVLLELKKDYQRGMVNILVRIDNHVNDNLVRIADLRLLKVGSIDTQTVVIYGMGGIGKTTIAKFIYYKLLESFECHSFLADVREMARQPNGLVRLQEQFLRDTANWCRVIADVNDGINLIKERFFFKKVLIVLDDVNEKSQLDCLVGNGDWFRRGSRIIVTTRNKHVLNTLKVDEVYEPMFMNSQQSLQLFNMHAFRKRFVPEEYISISRQVASTAAGLPLAIVAIGSLLFGKGLDEWEDALQKLNESPSHLVMNNLRISYDGLNYMQQKIFLDIACLFNGMVDKTYAFYMWNDCGYHPEKEIDVLCRMSLVKLGDDNVLRMHDLLRDFGREIVRQENVMDLGKRSRLWNHKEALDVLVKQIGTKRVETLSIHSIEMIPQPRFTNVEFTKLVNLRYLQMNGADLVGDFKHLFPRLRWLNWHSCPLQFKPTNFHLKNLVILDLSHSGITENWECWNQIKMAKKLKVLDLSFCALTRTPDFSTYATLERLIIRFCRNLVKIDASIGHLKNLKVLDVSGSFNIRKLPDEILMLENLEVVTEYEVFLSFRGPNTFTDSLYHNLSGLRVRTFQDDYELCKGEEIRPELLKAIKESKISIPIFSRNYASSEWCLRELAQMVVCKRTMGQVILPIFYDVEPSDVQYLSGSYEEAFYEHERCFSDGTVKDWKEALREVGELKGWEVKNEVDEYEEKLIKEMIVPAVLLELKKNSMIGTNYLVGIDHHLNEMMRLLNVASSEVRIVGIHGMGGIGKTTIAKIIYNKLFDSFEYHSFLADVRETVQQRNGLVDLQKKLLTDTLKWCPDISDVDSGMDVLKHIFLEKKVLIVVDDVIESSQILRLVGKHDWFGLGSRIIVTSKDRIVLNALKVDAIYEPPFMSPVHSLQLFSIHAFRRKFPPKVYVSISKEVASNATGLPLALEVMGSFLSDKEKVVWEDILKKLKKISHDEVERKLRVTYEALNYAQRQIFLDIACLFTGMDKATVFYMWDDCGYHPEKEFNVLWLMSLVNVGDTNELRMHDQFRTLGRKIVHEEKILGNRSRLWSHKDALDILEGRRGTEKVEAISLCFELGSRKKPRFSTREFANLKFLRYLRADGIQLFGDFKDLFDCLRWLCWHGCPPHFKPTNFHLNNLVILDLSDSGITEDWGGWNQIKMANKLKVLQLANCALRRTPDFSSYANLEILILRHCKSLVEIDRSVGYLKNLKVLDLSYTDIRKLPDEIWMLEKLEVLDFKHCSSLKDIPSNMESL